MSTAPTDSLLPMASRAQAFRRCWAKLASRPGGLMVVVLTGIVAALSGLIGPIALGWLVDQLRAAPSWRPVMITAIAVGVGAALNGVAVWLGWRTLARVGEETVASLREDAMSAALDLDSAVVERAGHGDLVSRIAEESRVVSEAIAMVVPMMVSSVVAIVVCALGLLAVDWRLGLVGLVAIPMYLASLRWYLGKSGPYYAAERIAFGRRAGLLLGGISGATTLRAYGRGSAELARIDDASARARDIGIDVFGMLTRFFARNNRAELVVLGLILGSGFFFVRAGWTSVGAVATAALIFHMLFNPLGTVVGLFDQVQSAAASLVRMVGVAQQEPRTGIDTPPADSRGITVEGLSHRYREDGALVLADVALLIEQGQSVALVGATGAGKTTLANAIAGTIEPSSGRATISGIGVRELSARALRESVMLISQEVHVFAATLRDNLTWGRHHDDDQIGSALARVRAGAWVAQLPERLDTRVGDGGHRLSAAQAQQVALARVLLADPPFVVLDEATAESGSAVSRDLDEAAAEVVRGRGALIVAHRLSQARGADKIVVMAGGRIVETGTHDQLVAADGRYAQLWAAWSGTG